MPSHRCYRLWASFYLTLKLLWVVVVVVCDVFRFEFWSFVEIQVEPGVHGQAAVVAAPALKVAQWLRDIFGPTLACIRCSNLSFHRRATELKVSAITTSYQIPGIFGWPTAQAHACMRVSSVAD